MLWCNLKVTRRHREGLGPFDRAGLSAFFGLFIIYHSCLSALGPFSFFSPLLSFSILGANMLHMSIPSNAGKVTEGLLLLWFNVQCSQQPLRTLWSRWGTPAGWFLSRASARLTDISLSAWWPRRGRGTSGRRTNMAPHHFRSRTYLWEKRRSLQVRILMKQSACADYFWCVFFFF